ncbi:glycosyl hydrolase family 8 [Pontiella sulfatireligans]|uniref:cellulase n=1 Tax=Pontiella sulfatireligans TaxID=2750658 RepID=A0A6C2UIG1_9BACT|nr:glycosyl hydrolase family 8 [Pontiella sulfatireligans]VGO19211.1 Endoglucanase A [Pontiella sulfatireligans]
MQQVKPDRCQLPKQADPADARHAYAHWKTTLVTGDGANGFRRVVRLDTPDGIANSTVSEGIAYGMILSVYFDDQELFDDLFRYSLHWVDSTGLMAWYINPEGTKACPGADSPTAATDSDEDIAFALIMADSKWGGSGALAQRYRDYALRQVALVKKHEIEHETGIVKPGNQWGGADLLNLSYFAPAFFEVFGRYTDDVAFWDHVIDVNYTALFNSLNKANGNAENGLVPAWSNAKGEPVTAFEGAPTHYQTDSARTPFRIAQHYCWTGDPRAKAYLEKVNAFFGAQGAGKLTDEYELDGTPRPAAAPIASSRSAVIVGCAGVAAMTDSAYHDFALEAYDLLKTLKLTARSTYYQLSWTAMSLAFMSGEYVDLTQNVKKK